MATGRQAFAGNNPAVIMDAILHNIPEPAGRLNPELASEMDRIISKALEKDRDLRYQSAAELRADLKRLKRDTESGRSPGVGTTAIEKTPRPRRRRAVVVGAASVLLLSVGFGTYKWARLPVEQRMELPERQLTSNASENWIETAAISPDGKYLAYSAGTGLQVRSIDSGETHPVTLPAGLQLFDLSWFPEGGKLLASMNAPGDTAVSSIWALTVVGEGAPRKVLQSGMTAAISPDGRLITYLEDSPAKEVWVCGINGEAPRKLFGLEEEQRRLFDPVWSPDGRWIAYLKIWYGPSMTSQVRFNPRRSFSRTSTMRRLCS